MLQQQIFKDIIKTESKLNILITYYKVYLCGYLFLNSNVLICLDQTPEANCMPQNL